MAYNKLGTVLIVEDAADQRMLLKAFIDYLGLHVLEAEDGLAAIELIQKHSIDLLVTDFAMPRMDGIALLNWCRAHELAIPIILFSSDAKLLEVQAVDCCSIILKSKPIDWGYLAAAINAADRHTHEGDCAFGTFKQQFEHELDKDP
jgi:CheY-like chemotaxis protein